MAKRKTNNSYIPEIIVADGTKQNLWEGLETSADDPRSIRKGQTPDELNWVTSQKGDNVQLRGGKLLIGTTRRTGGHVTGLGVGTLANGNQVIAFTANESIYYFNGGTDTHETTIPNMLGDAANGEDVNIFPYTSISGSYLYITSPHSSIYKMPIANPQSVIDQSLGNLSQNALIKEFLFGFAKIDQGTYMGLNRFSSVASVNRDVSGFYLGRVDLNGTVNPFPSQISVPNAPTGIPSSTGGNMASGTYYYVLTAIDANGNETTKGAQSLGIIVSSGGSVGSITLSWIPVAGAASYNIYRTTSTGTYTSPSFIKKITRTNSQTTLPTTYTDTFNTPITGAPPASTLINIITPIATGDGSTKNFSGTFASLSPGTFFGVQITDGNEIFNDDKNGNLIGSLGGTGTINYGTGAWSVVFNTAPTNGVPITAAYFGDNATNGGVLDFTIDTGDTTGTYAQVFRQDDAGGIGMGIAAFQGIQYCLHQQRTWNTQINSSPTTGDRTFENDPYWSKIGIPCPRAFFETGDGVLFIDNTDAQNPKVSILEIPPSSTNLTVVPVPISDDLDLSSFTFTKAVVYRFGEYDFMSCITSVDGFPNTYNSQTFMRNIYSSNWDLTDFTPSCLGIYQGNLVMGDALSPNIFQIFSGFDDDGGIINNFRNSSYYDCDLEGLKQIDYVHVAGLIQPNQSIQIALSFDFGNYITYFTISGRGSYVNQAIQVEVGGTTIGSSVIGSGAGGGIVANPFEFDIPVFTDNFEYVSAQIQALGIGYAEVDKLSYKGVRHTQRAILPTQTQN